MKMNNKAVKTMIDNLDAKQGLGAYDPKASPQKRREALVHAFMFAQGRVSRPNQFFEKPNKKILKEDIDWLKIRVVKAIANFMKVNKNRGC